MGRQPRPSIAKAEKTPEPVDVQVGKLIQVQRIASTPHGLGRDGAETPAAAGPMVSTTSVMIPSRDRA
jgi:hypothetical protein